MGQTFYFIFLACQPPLTRHARDVEEENFLNSAAAFHLSFNACVERHARARSTRIILNADKSDDCVIMAAASGGEATARRIFVIVEMTSGGHKNFSPICPLSGVSSGCRHAVKCCLHSLDFFIAAVVCEF